MDQYEDVSDCEVDHSFFNSNFEGEVKKDATATESAKTENNEHIQTEGTSLSKPVLKMETKVVEDVSPVQSFELASSNDKKLKIQRQENVSQDLCEPEKDRRCHQKVLHEAVNLNNLLKGSNMRNFRFKVHYRYFRPPAGKLLLTRAGNPELN
uniref:Uncharacterized protein n=1 Tax=Sphaerodactylus townsendi TaxID=933632 RepID=A0ACB8EQF7_9SAUR